MEMSLGIQPNCSEMVIQICGVTNDIAEQMKSKFKEALIDKYAPGYLDTYADDLFRVPGKYCLNLYRIDNESPMEDWGTIHDIAIEMGLIMCTVDFCSQPVDNDESMEYYTKSKESQDNGFDS